MKYFRLITVLMAFCMLFGLAVVGTAAEETEIPPTDIWDGTVDTSWYNTEDRVFTLTTAEQLAGLAAIVNGTASGIVPDSFYGKTVNLAADIVLNSGNFQYSNSKSESQAGTLLYNGEPLTYVSGNQWSTPTQGTVYSWTPIGNLEGNNNIESVVLTATAYKPGIFCGSFNGQGHTVSGLFVKTSKESVSDCYKGLFGTFAGKSLKNLTVTNSYVSGAGRCGSIAGMVYGMIAKTQKEDAWLSYVEKKQCTILENLHSDGTVTAYHTTAGNRMSGGLFGIVRLYDKGNDLDANVSEQVSATGGVIYITRCSFSGTVDCGTGQFAGGIAGWLAGFAMKAADEGKYDIVVDNCLSTATLISAKYAGGLAAYGYRADFTFRHCVSVCTVLTDDNGPQGAFMGISYYSNKDASDHMAALVIQESWFLSDSQNSKFADALGTLSGNMYPITNSSRTDLSGAVKANAMSDITGLEQDIWMVTADGIVLKSDYIADPDDPTSAPILPSPVENPRDDQPDDQTPSTSTDEVTDTAGKQPGLPTPGISEEQSGDFNSEAPSTDSSAPVNGGCKSGISLGVAVWLVAVGLLLTDRIRKKKVIR